MMTAMLDGTILLSPTGASPGPLATLATVAAELPPVPSPGPPAGAPLAPPTTAQLEASLAWTDDVVKKIEATLARVTACPLFDHDWQHLAEHCEDPVGMILGVPQLEAIIRQIDCETSGGLHTAAEKADKHECDMAALQAQILQIDDDMSTATDVVKEIDATLKKQIQEDDIATLKKQIIGNISATVITADQVEELIKAAKSQGATIVSLLGTNTLQEARIKELEKNVRDLATGLQQFHFVQNNINQRHASSTAGGGQAL